MKLKIIILFISLLFICTACSDSKKDNSSLTPTPTGEEVPSPTPYMDEKLARAIEAGADGIRNSAYCVDGKIGTIPVNLNEPIKIDIGQRKNKACYSIYFGSMSGNIYLAVAYVAMDDLEVVTVELLK